MQFSQQFYNQFSPYYREYAKNKHNYLDRINQLIIDHTKKQNNLKIMLDVGSGDGIRASELSKQIGIDKLTLLDNSQEMNKLCRQIKNADIIFGDITQNHIFEHMQKFNIITCLWNVLGHIDTDLERKQALQNIFNLLSTNGLFFLDINNRYNASNYGFKVAFKNIIKDIFYPSEFNGDIDFCITVKPNLKIPAHVHIFSPREIQKLIVNSGFKIIKKYYIDYNTGQIRKNFLSGQIFYVLNK